MDFWRSEQGNKHVLVFQDFLTKLFPMPDQKTERIVKILVDEVIPFFGVPEVLLSDRGTNFLSHLMKDVCSDREAEYNSLPPSVWWPYWMIQQSIEDHAEETC